MDKSKPSSAIIPTTSPAKGGAEVVSALENLALPIVGHLFVARGGATVRRVAGLEHGPDESSELARISDVRSALEPICASLRTSAPVGKDQAKEGE